MKEEFGRDQLDEGGVLAWSNQEDNFRGVIIVE
jgi:hypothetical protein